ncbi:MAG TPA: biopolymer transporter ExbD [Vicinamibacterales bacterium]|nr:biopolymer transporter ExbD [Vicinamibacterales bacterium]
MQIGKGETSLNSEINITPLVDVVLVLLIIFMVIVPLLMQGYDANIPRASSNIKPAQAVETQLILSIAPAACPILTPPKGEGIPADCNVTLNDETIPAAELPARVAGALGSRPAEEHVLFLSADDTLNYEGVLRIIDLAKSGVEDLKVEFVATQ